MRYINSNEPLLAQLDKRGLSLDQKLFRALELSATIDSVEPEDSGFPDSYLFLALYRLNTIISRLVSLEGTTFNSFQEYENKKRCNPSEVIPGSKLTSVLNNAIDDLDGKKTIGVRNFLRGIVETTYEEPENDLEWLGYPGQIQHDTFSIEVLLKSFGYSPWTSVTEVPQIETIFKNLRGLDGTEDYQYLLTLQEGKVAFRPVSILDTVSTDAVTGSTNLAQALLPHFQDAYTVFTVNEVAELEDLLNNSKTKENDLQKFFERNPRFLRLWQHREIIPHPYLTREDDGPLIPDFILADPNFQRHLILELKLPSTRIVRMRENRERFATVILEARSQLLEYRDWFENKHNREAFKENHGIELYRPRIGVIVGNSKEFTDDYQRQKLVERAAPLEVYTYDDIANMASKRLTLLAP